MSRVNQYFKDKADEILAFKEKERDYVENNYNDLKKFLRLKSRGYTKLSELKEAMSK